MTRSADPAVRALVDGVLWPGFLGTAVPDWLRRDLDGGLAGAVLFAHNLGGDDERAALAHDLHDRRDDVLVGVDEEGGNVTRLESASGSTLPGAAQLGRVDDLAATETVGAELARRVAAVGANVVLAPDADVNVDPRNPVIGVRSFGDDAALVSRHAAALVRGIRSGGAAACAKHWPGHGDTHVDSHHGLPVLGMPERELERIHLEAFRAAIAAGVPAVMTAHLVVPSWGAEPATMNPVALGRLRGLGFDGAVITDALDMAAIRETVGTGVGAVRALLAGADLLCLGNPANPWGGAPAPDADVAVLAEVRRALLDAVDDGSVPVARLEEAGRRVRALADHARAAADAASVAAAAGRAPRLGPGAALELARAAIDVTRPVPPVDGPAVVLDVRRRATLAVDASLDAVASVLAAGGPVRRVDPAEDRGRALVAAVEAADHPTADGCGVVVLVDRLADPPQAALVVAVARVRPDAVVVNVGAADGAPDIAAGTDAPALPVVHARAASRLAAIAVRERLEAGTTPAKPAAGVPLASGAGR
ncbi:glycoside hydrolase family 3 protein [Agromyces indicus]|uniref:Glycoside hydrolase family 3 N-terminal domain-containing protein n=2 Tax=Agromyces TaxID=33877 RepID=A0ABU1FMM4_9MICO|nr:glycoside hydrolase family 3 N-terminal domain-containing protein [Agromyces indicus]MDR5692706.1 glycoside hydrolase family 3 N-terminal domain-containing protein [Agromyces indicus]